MSGQSYTVSRSTGAVSVAAVSGAIAVALLIAAPWWAGQLFELLSLLLPPTNGNLDKWTSLWPSAKALNLLTNLSTWNCPNIIDPKGWMGKMLFSR